MDKRNQLILSDVIPKKNNRIIGALRWGKSQITRIIPTQKKTETVKPKESSLLSLKNIEDSKLAEKLLVEMTNEEILGNHNAIDLIKVFHPDMINSAGDGFNVSIRNLITKRLIAIHKKHNDNKDSISNTPGSFSFDELFNRLKQIIECLELYELVIIDDIIYLGQNKPLFLTKVFCDYAQKIKNTSKNIESDLGYLSKSISTALIDILESQQFLDGKSIHEKKLIGQIIKIENEYNLNWSDAKFAILEYVTTYYSTNFYMAEAGKREIRKLEIICDIDTTTLRKRFSQPKKSTLKQPKSSHPKIQITPRSYKKPRN